MSNPTRGRGVFLWKIGSYQRGKMSMEILGLSPDLVLAVLMLVGWIVLMRFVLPRMGVST